MNQRTTPNREQLFHWIQMVGFACLDAALFLDTHPDCQEALVYYRKHNSLRRQAMEEYARLYGPLTQDEAAAPKDRWNWIAQPWPWEGGEC